MEDFSDHMEWTPTRDAETRAVALTPFTPNYPSSPPVPKTPIETPAPISPLIERLHRQDERQTLSTRPVNLPRFIDMRHTAIRSQVAYVREQQIITRQTPYYRSQPRDAAQVNAYNRPADLSATSNTFRIQPDTPYQPRLPYPITHADETGGLLGKQAASTQGSRLLDHANEKPHRRPIFNPMKRRSADEVPELFRGTHVGASISTIGAERHAPLPTAESSAPESPKTPQSLKRSHDDFRAGQDAAEENTDTPPRLFKRVCGFLLRKVFGSKMGVAAPKTASPATRRRKCYVPGAWPVAPVMERKSEVDTRPPARLELFGGPPFVVFSAAVEQQQIEEAEVAEMAAEEDADEALMVPLPPTPPHEAVVEIEESPPNMWHWDPTIVSVKIDNPSLYEEPRDLVRPKFQTEARRILNERKRTAKEEKLEQERKLEKEHIRLSLEAVNEELSFLDDAPHARVERRVHFVESAFFERPFPTKTRLYAVGEPIGHPVSPLDKPSFIGAREVVAPVSPSEGGTPAVVRNLLPHFELSPSESANVATPENLRDLGTKFGLFEVSSAYRKKQEEAQRKKDEAVREAARKVAEELERLEQERRKVEEEARRKAKIIKDLSDEWDATIRAAMAIKNKGKQMGKSGINRKDFGTLLPQRGLDDPRGWLNDEVVNAYLTMMVQRALDKTGYVKKSEEVPKFHAFNTNLYTNIQTRGYDSVMRWLFRANIQGRRMLRCEQILIPINNGGVHWTLMCISGTNRTISYYDSMVHGKADHTEQINIAYKFLLGTLGPKTYKPEEWTVIDTSSVQQANALDCGVFVCINSLAIISGKDPLTAFSASDMPAARRQIAATLYNGEFTDEFDF